MPLQVDLLRAAEQFLQRDGRIVLATIVDVEGSTYHRSGTRMLIAENGEHYGSISGGCLEKDLIQKAWFQVRNGPALIEYDTRIEDDDDHPLPTGPFNTGCHGVVQVLLQEIERNTPSPLDVLTKVHTQQQTCVLATVYSHKSWPAVAVADYVECNSEAGGALANLTNPLALQYAHTANHSFSENGASLNVLIERIDPQQQLTIFGAGDDAMPLNLLAQQMGWRVTLVDQRTNLANNQRFAGAKLLPISDAAAVSKIAHSRRDAAVLMTHNIARDADLIPALMQHCPGYVGVLGPAARWNKLLRYWKIESINVKNTELISAPIGLDIGADNAAEIATAIMAEIIAKLRQRPGNSLANSTAALHRPSRRYTHSG